VQRSILPKLAWALRDALAIDPRAQDLAAWRWVAAWAPVLAPAQLAGLLEQHFWPKWHAVLRHWLAHAPDFDEVTAWFLGWKARPRAARLRAPARRGASPACARVCRPVCGPLGALCRGARGQAERSGHLRPRDMPLVGGHAVFRFMHSEGARGAGSGRAWRGPGARRAGAAAGRGARPRARAPAADHRAQRHERRGRRTAAATATTRARAPAARSCRPARARPRRPSRRCGSWWSSLRRTRAPPSCPRPAGGTRGCRRAPGLCAGACLSGSWGSRATDLLRSRLPALRAAGATLPYSTCR